MTRLVFALITSLIFIWPDSSEAQFKSAIRVCAISKKLTVGNFGVVGDEIKRCGPGNILYLVVDKNFNSASNIAARVCRFDRQIVVSELVADKNFSPFPACMGVSGFSYLVPSVSFHRPDD